MHQIINTQLKSLGQVVIVHELIAPQIIKSQAIRRGRCIEYQNNRDVTWNIAKYLAFELKSFYEGIVSTKSVYTEPDNFMEKILI